MTWDRERRQAWAAQAKERWAAARALAGCVCTGRRANGAVVHERGCPLRGGGRATYGRRSAALRALWAALGDRERRARLAGLAEGRRSWKRCRRRGCVCRWCRRRLVARVRMLGVWEDRKAGRRPISAALGRVLLARGVRALRAPRRG